MEQTTHMRLSGHAHPFALTPDAHRQLLRYLADARAVLSTEPDGDETVRDMENAIGERLSASADADPIDENRMLRILEQTGAVAVDAPASPRATTRGRFWCRIDEGKWFGGICLGIATRSELRVDWTRTIVLLLLLVTGGVLGLIYLALLLILPRVSTVQEYERLRDSPAREPMPR